MLGGASGQPVAVRRTRAVLFTVVLGGLALQALAGVVPAHNNALLGAVTNLETYEGNVGSQVLFVGTGTTDAFHTIQLSWSFGDPNCTELVVGRECTRTGASVNHTYVSASTFTVTFTVTDNDGTIRTDIASAVIAQADSVPPTIANPPPGGWQRSGTLGNNVLVNASVTDQIALASNGVKLHYFIDLDDDGSLADESDTNVSMTLQSGTTFQGAIPGSAVTHTTVGYYVEAIDNALNTARFPSIGANDTGQGIINGKVRLTFAGVSIANPTTGTVTLTRGNGIPISAAVTTSDPAGISSSLVFWRVLGATTFTPAAMTKATGSNLWTATIADAPFSTGTILQYYIQASDPTPANGTHSPSLNWETLPNQVLLTINAGSSDGGFSGGGGGGGGGAAAVLEIAATTTTAPEGALAAFMATITSASGGATINITTSDPSLPGLNLTFGSNASNIQVVITVWPESNPPTGTLALPPGIDVGQFLEINIIGAPEGIVNMARISVSLPASAVPDANAAVLLHLKDGVWVPDSRITLTLVDGRYEGNATSSGLSLLAVSFDIEDPTVELSLPSGPLRGVVSVLASAADNLRLGRVEFFVDGTLVSADASLPFGLDLDTAVYPDGEHTIRAVAYDYVEHSEESSESRTFNNLGTAVIAAPASGTVPSWAYVAVGIGVAAAAGVVAVAVVMKRRGRGGAKPPEIGPGTPPPAAPPARPPATPPSRPPAAPPARPPAAPPARPPPRAGPPTRKVQGILAGIVALMTLTTSFVLVPEPVEAAVPVTSEIKLTNAVGVDGNFGADVDLEGPNAIVGAAGSAFVYTYDYGLATWVQQAQFGGTGAFGSSVAFVGPTTPIVGNYTDDSVTVFNRDGPDWDQVQIITPLDASPDADLFGLAVEGDENTLVVGAPADDDTETDSGSAYVFLRNEFGVWSQVQKLAASDPGGSDAFGTSVAIDGDVILVGARSGDAALVDDTGAVYVFRRDFETGSWAEEAKLLADDAAAFDNFGQNVSIDGGVAIVGAPGDDDAVFGDDSGSVYAWQNAGPGTWDQVQKLTASDAASNHGFGYSIALGGNGLVVGTNPAATGGADVGAAYVFLYGGDGAWVEEAVLRASDGDVSDEFGGSVALTNSVFPGNITIIVGARFADRPTDDEGAAYVYQVGPTECRFSIGGFRYLTCPTGFNPRPPGPTPAAPCEPEEAFPVTTFGYRTCPVLLAFFRSPDGVPAAAIDLSDEEVSPAIALPFSFNYHGTTANSIFVSDNGFIRFDRDTDAACCEVEPLPSSNPFAPNGILAGLWADFDGSSPEGSVAYYTLGAQPNREFVVSFITVPYFEDPSQNATFQVVLHETSNDFEIVIQKGNTSVLDFFGDPRGAVGFEDCRGTDGLTIASSDAGTLTNVAWRTYFPARPGAGPICLQDEEISPPIQLPFHFKYFGIQYDEAFVSSNGFLRFDEDHDTGCCSGEVLPFSDGLRPDGLIAGLWGDLNPSGGGSITHYTLGDEPNRQFVVNFTEVPFFGAPAYNASFQIILHEGTNDFEIVLPAAATTIPTSLGPRLGTVGYEDCFGSEGLTIYHDIGNVSERAWYTTYPVPPTPLPGGPPPAAVPACPPAESSILLTECSSPTAFQYVTCPTAFAPRVPTGDTNMLELFDDQLSQPVSFPFSFNYFGTDYDRVLVSENGFVQFNGSPTSGTFLGQYLPDGDQPNNVIAGLWTDLYRPGGGQIRTFELGTFPNREFVVSFENVSYHDTYFGFTGDPLDNTSFQIVLNESGNFSILVDHGSSDVGFFGFGTGGYEDCFATDGLTVFAQAGPLSQQAWITTFPPVHPPPIDCSNAGGGQFFQVGEGCNFRDDFLHQEDGEFPFLGDSGDGTRPCPIEDADDAGGFSALLTLPEEVVTEQMLRITGPKQITFDTGVGGGVGNFETVFHITDAGTDPVRLAFLGTDGESVNLTINPNRTLALNETLQTNTEVQWDESEKLVFADAAAGDRFGHAVAADNLTVLIGAPGRGDFDEGAAYFFERDPITHAWGEPQEVSDGVIRNNDLFGSAVAMVGDTAFVGAPSLSGEASPGYVYVYGRDSGSWGSPQILLATGGTSGDRFGSSIDIHGDLALIGAPGRDNAGSGVQDVGAVYVFMRDATNSWSQVAVLSAGDGGEGDAFGTSLDLSSNFAGTFAYVGAPFDDTVNGTDAGSAYIFFQDPDGSWRQVFKMVADNGQPDGRFGTSVRHFPFCQEDIPPELRGGEMPGCGTAALIGAPGDDTAPPFGGVDSGSVYMFAGNASSSEGWGQIFNPQPGEGGDFGSLIPAAPDPSGARFGQAMAFHIAPCCDFPFMVAIAGPGQDSETAADAGLAQTFGPDFPFLHLAASDGASGDEFGSSIALTNSTSPVSLPAFITSGLDRSPVADLAFVGAPNATVSGFDDAGAVYAFDLNVTQPPIPIGDGGDLRFSMNDPSTGSGSHPAQVCMRFLGFNLSHDSGGSCDGIVPMVIDNVTLFVPVGWTLELGFTFHNIQDTGGIGCDWTNFLPLDGDPQSSDGSCVPVYSGDGTAITQSVTFLREDRVLRLDGVTGEGTARVALDVPFGVDVLDIAASFTVRQIGSGGAFRIALRDLDGNTPSRPGIALLPNGMIDMVGTSPDDESIPGDFNALPTDYAAYVDAQTQVDLHYHLDEGFQDGFIEINPRFNDSVPFSDYGFDELVLVAGPGWVVDFHGLQVNGHGFGFGGGGSSGGGGFGGGGGPVGDSFVTVRVTNTDDVPLPGIQVQVFADWQFADAPYFNQLTTDPSGNVTFTSLPPGHLIAFASLEGTGLDCQVFFSSGQPEGVYVPNNDPGVVPTELIRLELSSIGCYIPPPRCGGIFGGQIVGPDGQGIPDIQVSAWQEFDPSAGGTPVEPPLSPYGSAITDVNGYFELRMLGNASYAIYIDGSSEGFIRLFASGVFVVPATSDLLCDAQATRARLVPSAWPAGSLSTDEGVPVPAGYNGTVKITLARGMSISGTVLAANGPAIAGAFVSVQTRQSWDPNTGQPIGDVPHSFGYDETDENGNWTAGGLLAIPGTLGDAVGFDVYVSPPPDSDYGFAHISYPDPPIPGRNDTASSRNFDPDGNGQSDSPSNDTRLDFNLTIAATLSGFINISGTNDERVPDAWMNLWTELPENNSWAWGSSGPDGFYEARGLRFNATGVDYRMSVWPPFDSPLASLFTNVTMTQQRQTLNLTLDRGTSLSGCVVDSLNNSVVDAWVSAWSFDTAGGGWAETGPDGCFRMNGLRNATYSLYIYPPFDDENLASRQINDLTLDSSSPGFNPTILDVSSDGFRLHDVGRATIRLGSGGWIEGCVKTNDGPDDGDADDPVPNAWVGAWSGNQSHWGGGITDSLGCYNITRLVASDDYYLMVWPPYELGLRYYEEANVQVNASLPTFRQVFLDAGHTIVGDIVDTNGNPVEGVFICAWREDYQAFGWSVTDANGHFEVRGLPAPGDADDDQGWFLWIAAPEGFASRQYPMNPFSGASGFVHEFDEDSADNENATDPDFPTGQNLTDRGLVLGTSGRLVITLDDIANGNRDGNNRTTTVDTNFDTAHGHSNVEATIGDDDFEPIVLDAGQTLTGYVLRESGTGISNAKIWIWSPNGYGFDEADASGQWEISGLGTGAYDLWIETPLGRTKYETSDTNHDGVINDLDDNNLGCEVGATGDNQNEGDDTDTESPAGCIIQFEAPGSLLVNVNAGANDSGVYVQAYGASYVSGFTTDGETNDDPVADSNPNTADYGEVLFTDLVPGTYTVRLYRADCYVLFEGTVVVVANATRTINISLVEIDPPIDLEGNVTLAGSGATVPNIMVIAVLNQTNGNNTTYVTSTNNSGSFLFEDLPPGNYNVTAILNQNRQDSFPFNLDLTDLESADGADGDGVYDSDPADDTDDDGPLNPFNVADARNANVPDGELVIPLP